MSDDKMEFDRARELLVDETYLRDVHVTFGNAGADYLEKTLLAFWGRRDGISTVFGLLPEQEARWPRTRGAGHAIRFIGRNFINAFKEKSSNEIRSLHPIEIEEFVKYCMSIYETEPLSDALKTLAKALRGENKKFFPVWVKIRKLIVESPDFVAKYGLAEAEAENEGESGAVRLEQFANWLEKDDPSYQELAGYALRFLFAKPDSSIDVDALIRMSKSSSYIVRSSLGDLLINLHLQDRWPTELEWIKLGDVFLSPRFDFNNLDILDIRALREQQGLECQSVAEVTIDFHRQLKLDNDRLKSEPALKELADDYFMLGVDPHGLKEKHREKVWKVCANDPIAFEFVFRHLLRHPLWECSEAAASLLVDYLNQGNRDQRNCAKDFLRSILGKKEARYAQDWRLQAGAIEAAFALRHSDSSLFDEAVQGFSSELNNPRVRGLVAENVVAMVVEELDPDKRQELVEKWDVALKGWLQSNDAWVLEHMYRLAREPASKDDCLRKLLTEQPLSPLLVGVEAPDDPAWKCHFSKLDRKQYLKRIESNAARLYHR